MNCPRCSEELVQKHRSGVEVDYCPRCKGLWLDRGELEKIAQAEAEGWEEEEGIGAGPGRRRKQEKEGFFQNLLEMFGE